MKIDAYKRNPAALAADLVNTRGSMSGTDYMPDLPALRTFLEARGVTPPADLTTEDLAAIARARDRLKEVFFARDEASTAALLNSILSDHGAQPRIDPDGGGFRLGFTPQEAGIARYLVITAAMGLAELLVESGRSRFGICSAEDCRDVFVDTSRNRSRRYCTDSCSSRSNVAAFRARRRSS